nr:uncharacterized protein LOC116779198 [Danaus plexippus plexippus]
MAVESSEKSETKWTYTTYRFILWAYMMNDIAVVFTPVDMSHTGFYIYSVLYILFAIFIGIPLVYSELCIAQYTNHSIVSMWNFCPILRGVGHVIGTCNELRRFYKYDTVWNICRPYKNWGPQDKILFRSRNMFVPEIMTREFLYRQVRIHGYIKNYNKFKQKVNVQAVQEPTETLDWSALTSN